MSKNLLIDSWLSQKDMFVSEYIATNFIESKRDLKNNIYFLSFLIENEKMEDIKNIFEVNNDFPNTYSKTHYDISLMKNLIDICFSSVKEFKFKLSDFELNLLNFFKERSFFNLIQVNSLLIKFIYLGNVALVNYLLDFVDLNLLNFSFTNDNIKKIKINKAGNEVFLELDSFINALKIEHINNKKIAFNNDIDLGCLLDLKSQNQNIIFILALLANNQTILNKIEKINFSTNIKPFICSDWFPISPNRLLFSDAFSLKELVFLFENTKLNFNIKDDNGNNLFFYLTTFWTLEFATDNNKKSLSLITDFASKINSKVDLEEKNNLGFNIFDIPEIPPHIKDILVKLKDKKLLQNFLPVGKKDTGILL